MSKEVIAGVLKRRAVLAGEVDALRARVAATVADMRRLDAVIRQFDPAHDPAALERKRLHSPGAARGGEMAHFLLGELRKAGGPLTADLARRLVEARGAGDSPALGVVVRRWARCGLRTRKGGWRCGRWRGERRMHETVCVASDGAACP